jgi:ABC-2 type transport system permease protein
MGKIGLITWREYTTRVRKRSFIVLTILGPVLIALFYGILIYLVASDDIGQDEQVILVIDENDILNGDLEEGEFIKFEFGGKEMADLPDSALMSQYDGWLTIPGDLNIHDPRGVVYRSDKSMSMQTKEKMNRRLEKSLTKKKMLQQGISKPMMDSLKTNVSITSLVFDEDGQARSTSTELSTAIGMGLSIIIYMFIFMYGVQVMRGVIEEKSNRIVEVIISSVKPFQLMMGKVFGLALVGLTQILIWMILSGLFMFIITLFYMGDLSSLSEMMNQTPEMSSVELAQLSNSDVIVQSLLGLNFKFIISAFVVYFIGGYLMYSALFAAIGAAVDAETDTQQFMLPVTLPLVFSIVLSTSVVIRDPNGPMSFWLSVIPLSSPVVMMVRAPFINLHEQWWEVLLSASVLILSFCVTIWFAGRIYRTGILMYGKKATYKELFKWLFYKA